MFRNLAFASIIIAGIGCGGAQGTSPHDMSAEQHEAAASQEESASAEHATQYDPKQETTEQVCPPKRVCWTARANPTDKHRTDASEHHDLAAKHRAAAQALRDAEAGACAGIDEEDRDTSPFYFREDIALVEPIDQPLDSNRGSKSPMTRRAGGRAIVRAVPGMTAEWLQRVVNCHVARAAVVGHDDPDMSFCPLALKKVRATVTSTGVGFAVEVRAQDEATAKEVVRRMEALVATKTP